jgi:hypothetical protein
MVFVRLTNTLKKKLAALLIVAFCGTLAAPALAGAQDPTSDQYDPTITRVEVGGDDGTGLSSRVGPLPFTGFDVIAMAAVALAVTGLGLALQRAVSRESSDLT